VAVEEEAQSRGELVDVETGCHRRLDVREAVRQREGQLLRGGAARLADVVAADRDRVPSGHVLGAEEDDIGDQAHRRLHREDELLLRDVLLEDVVLQRAAELSEAHTLLVGDNQVLREHDRRR
jgi:hypothetical protein